METWYRKHDARKDRDGRFIYHLPASTPVWTLCGKPFGWARELPGESVAPIAKDDDPNPRFCERCRLSPHRPAKEDR